MNVDVAHPPLSLFQASGAGFPFTAEVTVEKYLSGVRIDSFLERHFRNYTSFRLQRLVRARQVKIDGVTAEVEDRVRTGEIISIRLLEPPDKMLPPQCLPVEILYEDPWMVVVNKPPGQVVHPCGNYHRETLLNAMQYHFDQQTIVPGVLRPGIVHRLDRLTSGVTVIAKEHIANRRLSTAFEDGKVRKTYLALVHGEVQGDLNTVNLPIGVVPGGESFLMTTAPDAIDPRPSRTTFETLERLGDYCW
ncbi:MAG: RluA family pseudouridine synthase [Planctomycetales bacterium]